MLLSLVPNKHDKGLRLHMPGFLTPPYSPVPSPRSRFQSRNSDPERARDEGESIVGPLGW